MVHRLVCVPAQTLYDIVRKLPDGSQVSFDTDLNTSQVIVDSGSAQFKLSFLPATDFPVMSEGELTHRFSMPASVLLTLIEKSKFAMSAEETRYYLNGVYFHVNTSENGTEALRAVATDGHRLAQLETSVPAGASGMPGVIIPRKTVSEIGKIIDNKNETDTVEIALSDSKISFHSGDINLLSKLVDGTFPDYDSAIPKDNNRKMEVDTKLLYQSVDRVSTVSTGKTRGIKFALSQGQLMLSAQSPDASTAEENIEVSFDAEPLEIGFNSRYMLEMISQLEGDTIQFLFSDMTAPALVSDPSDISGFYVIMPMRV